MGKYKFDGLGDQEWNDINKSVEWTPMELNNLEKVRTIRRIKDRLSGIFSREMIKYFMSLFPFLSFKDLKK